MLARRKGTERTKQFLNAGCISASTTECGPWLALQNTGDAYLSPLIVWGYMAEHGQTKSSSFTCAGLGLGDQILRSGIGENTHRKK